MFALQLGVGTGRNFEYYSPSVVRRLTAVDAVPAMIDVAREKATRLASTRPAPPPLLPIALGLAADATGISADLGSGLDLSKVEFVAGAAESLPFGDAQFDTVVDTFGLCSFEDPARVCAFIFCPSSAWCCCEIDFICMHSRVVECRPCLRCSVS